MPDSEILGNIIESAREVYKQLGNGFQEEIYQRALSIELNLRGIDHIREQDMPLKYKGHHIGNRRVDFFVGGEVMVEIKSVLTMEKEHLLQARNYVNAYGLQEGLLINFGAEEFELEKIVAQPKQ